VKLEEYRSWDDERLIGTINDAFEFAMEKVGDERRILLVEAEFYLTELNRREDERAEMRRDRIETIRHRVNLGLEFLVLVLIGLELFVGYRQEQDQAVAAKLEQEVLGKLQASSAATAATLTNLETTTEAMNEGIQTELGLNYALTVEFAFDKERQNFIIKNTGKTTIYLCGAEAGYNDPSFSKKSDAIIPGGKIEFTLPVLYDDLNDLPEGGSARLPLRIFLRNQYGVKYVIGSQITARQEKDNMTFKVDSFGVARENWSKK